MADLTGVIPPRLTARFGPPGRRGALILFPQTGHFSWFQGLESAGTFVPAQDYFCRSGVLGRDLKAEIVNRGFVMLSWVVTFLIVALIAGILGFGGIAGVSIEIAKTIFFIAVILFLISAVVGVARGRSRV
jgi:uncharacterized membrane protein YtjA (UPF0391 family)